MESGVDFLVAFFIVKGDSTMEKAMNLHHIMGFGSCFVSIFGGFGLPTIGQLTIMTEFSTLPLNYRSFLTKDE